MLAAGTARKEKGGTIGHSTAKLGAREKSREGQSIEAKSLKSEARRVGKLTAG